MTTKEQLKNEIDTLEDKQTLEFVYQLVQKLKMSSVAAKPTKKSSKEIEQKAMADFFGMHRELGIDSVEDELRLIRQGRLGRIE